MNSTAVKFESLSQSEASEFDRGQKEFDRGQKEFDRGQKEFDRGRIPEIMNQILRHTRRVPTRANCQKYQNCPGSSNE